MPHPGEFAIGKLHDNDNRSCLWGWSSRSFPGNDQAERMFDEEMHRIVGRMGFISVPCFNDHPSTTDAQRAAVWAEAAAKFGYYDETGWKP